MLTGQDYRRTLLDGRRIHAGGRPVADVTLDARFRSAVDAAAEAYDRDYKEGAEAVNPLFQPPRSPDDLAGLFAVIEARGTLDTATALCLLALDGTAALLDRDLPDYVARIRRYTDWCRRSDVRLAEVITDAKGDRSRGPLEQDDPDLYLRIARRDGDGVVLRGAKMHVSGAAIAHELCVLPTKRMAPGEEDYAVACAVPVGTPGVSLVTTSPAPAPGDERDYPVSRLGVVPESLVVFDDVHVPWERVFLAGEVAHSARFAHTLGLWERLGAVAHMARDADVLVGLAQLVTEANGLQRVAHIKDKIAEMALYATMIRAGLRAAIDGASLGPGTYPCPDELFSTAAKCYASSGYHLVVRHLHDIAGGAVVTAPSLADLASATTGPAVAKYLRGVPGIGAEERLRLFHAIRDLTADTLGGWRLVANIQGGGGLAAQRMVAAKHYDFETAKALARHEAGLSIVPERRHPGPPSV